MFVCTCIYVHVQYVVLRCPRVHSACAICRCCGALHYRDLAQQRLARMFKYVCLSGLHSNYQVYFSGKTTTTYALCGLYHVLTSSHVLTSNHALTATRLDKLQAVTMASMIQCVLEYER